MTRLLPELYLRQIQPDLIDLWVQRPVVTPNNGSQTTRMLNHAEMFDSRAEVLAFVREFALDPATLELVTLVSEPLDQQQLSRNEPTHSESLNAR